MQETGKIPKGKRIHEKFIGNSTKPTDRLSEAQFGFRKNKGRQKAILKLRLMTEKNNGKKKRNTTQREPKNDNINWTKMFEILETVGIKYGERRIT